ncbi:MAG TPA: DUF177 domain-containing protein [Clostridia bacterium]|nr:DUF177 domain-containing protein [Clostridia bacterium]
MQLEISGLKENKGQSLDFRFEEDFPSLNFGGRTIAFDTPVIVDGSATNVESGILVKCRVRAGIVVDCDRCLRPVTIGVETTAVEEFVEAKSVPAEGEDEDRDCRVFKGSVIDIKCIVYESILLNLPMKILCSSDCRGICSSCGTDLNLEECGCSRQDVDPRMEKLKDWFKE